MTRILIACPQCQRRLDATGQAPGTLLRCPCSLEVEVPLPHRDTAEVVRCSGCGGPRQQGARYCPFCNADYTLHEQDLDALCPACCHRVSRTARFCHHCGIPVLGDQVAELTDHHCPACETESWLRSRALHRPDKAAEPDPTAAISVLECPHCAGLWLSAEAFRLLEERALSGQLPTPVTPSAKATATPLAGGPAKATAPFGAGRAYRPCVTCGRLMNRSNYGGGSGVVVDICREHGIWFDFEELAQMLRWIHDGGPQWQLRKKMETMRQQEREQRTREMSSDSPSRSSVGSGLDWSEEMRLLKLLGDVFSMFLPGKDWSS